MIGIFGYILLLLGFHPRPILLGFVLGSRFEESFRRAMLISRGDLKVFVDVSGITRLRPWPRFSPIGAAAPDRGRAVAAALEFRLQGPRRAGHPFRSRSVKANGWAVCSRLKWSRA